jgi:hypothetical protein
MEQYVERAENVAGIGASFSIEAHLFDRVRFESKRDASPWRHLKFMNSLRDHLSVIASAVMEYATTHLVFPLTGESGSTTIADDSSETHTV